MPTFCRHNRFIERCPICSKTLPGHAVEKRGSRPGAGGSSGARAASSSAVSRGPRRPRGGGVRVYVDGQRRAVDDGYRCELVQGLRSSADAHRLLEEIGFASARLDALATAPPGAYAEAAALARAGELERASWLCFLIAYLCPLGGEQPFLGIAATPSFEQAHDLRDAAIDALPLGPRTCHVPGRGAATLHAYLAWAQRAGSQRIALGGEPSWSAKRRFERVFERMALPGLPRWGRFELLVLLGWLGLHEMKADSLHLAAAASHAPEAHGGARSDASDPVLAAAKRIFGIGDVLLLERRARRLAEEISVPIEALELGLFNWLAVERATVGFDHELRDPDAIAQGAAVLGL